MKNRQMKRFRPCNIRCMVWCSFPLILSFAFLVGLLPALDKGRIACVAIGLILALLTLAFWFVSALKWNSFVYIDLKTIAQKQYNKSVIIYYDEITDIKLSHSCKVPHLITICKSKEKIAFEVTSNVLNEFRTKCSNAKILDQMNYVLKENHLDI